MQPILIFLRGLIIGFADAVPGVSGGTMAFILGIYDRLITAIRNLNIQWLTRHIMYVTSGEKLFLEQRNRAWKKLDLKLLVPLGIGVVVAMFFAFSSFSYLIEVYKSYTYAFFAGLILASAIVLVRRMQQVTKKRVSFIIIGFLGGLSLGLVEPLVFGSNWFLWILSGFLAATAMLLPGVSGSYVLVILGQYKHASEAVKTLDFSIIFPIVIGIVIGIYVMSHVIYYLLKNQHQLTIFFLTGLIIGSLSVIFREIEVWNILVIFWLIVGMALPILIDIAHWEDKLKDA